jgi:hypothetical protein
MIKEKIRNLPILSSTKKPTLLVVKELRKNKRMKVKIKKLKGLRRSLKKRGKK